MTERPKKTVARYLTKDPEEDSSIIEDWHLTDGRKGDMYPLHSISTAVFDRGDYSNTTAIIYRRDHEATPMYVEYPEDWVTLSKHGIPKIMRGPSYSIWPRRRGRRRSNNREQQLNHRDFHTQSRLRTLVRGPGISSAYNLLEEYGFKLDYR